MKDKNTQEIISNSSDQTVEIGQNLAAILVPGDIIALIGNLAAGKTHLIKGICLGLGAGQKHEVSSPTFVLMNEYQSDSGLWVYHLDAYRLDDPSEIVKLGFDDYCRPDSIVLIEWADKVLPALTGFDIKTIYMEHIGPNQRKITLAGFKPI